MSTAVEAAIKVTLVTWYQVCSCKKAADAKGQISVMHEAVGYFSAFEAARRYGESQGWEYVPHELYLCFVKRQGSNEIGFLVIPHYVALTSSCDRRGYLAADRLRAEIELSE